MDSEKSKKNLPVAKIIIVGGQNVGKTSILNRFVDGVFSETAPTLGVDSKAKIIEVDGLKFKMQIWDTTGQERFKSLAKNFFRGANGAIFALDLTDAQSLKQARVGLSNVRLTHLRIFAKLFLQINMIWPTKG